MDHHFDLSLLIESIQWVDIALVGRGFILFYIYYGPMK